MARTNLISVIVPTHNEEGNISSCLESIRGQEVDGFERELIVVDYRSSDKTVEIAENFADKVIQQSSKGVGGARNDGVRASDGAIIATTDADCRPEQGWLDGIADRISGGEDVVAVTGPLNPMLNDEIGFLTAKIYDGVFEVTNNLGAYASAVTNHIHLCGANSGFDREAFMRVGGYSPLPFSDDVEIAGRLRKEGRLVFDRRVAVGYSTRRIEEMGLLSYIYTIVWNDINATLLKRKNLPDNYSGKEYS